MKKYVWDNEHTLTKQFSGGEFTIDEIFRWRNKKGKQFASQGCWYLPGDSEWVKNTYGGYTKKSFLKEHGEDGVRAIWEECGLKLKDRGEKND